MVWLLLWLLLGLAGYCVMAFRDVLRRIEQVSVDPKLYDRVNYTNIELLKAILGQGSFRGCPPNIKQLITLYGTNVA